jgi:hypothetical protein
MVDPEVVDSWDSQQPGADWDSGLQWDVTIGPSLGDVQPYLDLITSEHNKQPKFMSMLRVVFQPVADIMANTEGMIPAFDLDTAVGVQLDAIGEWVGITRQVSVPLTDVYFTLDDPNLGFDSGTWYNTFNPLSGLVVLPDEDYRTLLRAKVANNQWDGTIPGAYEIWDTMFEETGIGLLIQDLGTMHMILAITGPIPNAVTLALFRGGYLSLKPAGVMIDAYLTPSVPDTPYFGFDVQNENIAGFDYGAWGLSS